MNCSISGEVPEEPVVSMKSGHIFEKRLIEKHLAHSATCPVTGEDLAVADLLPVQANKVVRPRPPSAASIPGVLKIMQSEWDALMLETHTLKKHLNATREELALTLYQHDAACRVIARLTKERDEARAALADARSNAVSSKANGADDMDMEDASAQSLPAAVVEKMEETAKALTKPRKKTVKALQAAVASPEAIKGYTKTASHTLHTASKPGITCLSIRPHDDSHILTGGVDGQALLVARSSGKVSAKLKGHKKSVTSAKFHPTGNAIYTTSEDETAIIWAQNKDSFKVGKTLSESNSSLVGCSVHASGDFLVTADAAGSWHFYDAHTGDLHQSVREEKSSGFTCVEFHPDGLILGAGTNNKSVAIYDVKSLKNVCSFSNGHKSPISSISFSENGYFLASADTSGVVKLWDLRRLEDFHTINVENSGAVNSVRFDMSGSYLAIAGSNTSVYKTKPWELVQSYDSQAAVTDVAFGPNASFLATCSADRTLNTYA